MDIFARVSTNEVAALVRQVTGWAVEGEEVSVRRGGCEEREGVRMGRV